VLIAERDDLYPVSLADLEKVRSSTFQPFPPKNAWCSFDFSNFRPPSAAETRLAIANQASAMLNPPIRNMGVKIRTAVERIPGWPKHMNADELRWALFNTFIFINAKGGNGGGIFRFMFSRFEAAHQIIRGSILNPRLTLIPYKQGSRNYLPVEHLDIVSKHIRMHLQDVIKTAELNISWQC
jgi:hypothetical protein